MKLGLLNDRCRIERPAPTQDATFGTMIPTWALVAVRHCQLQDQMPSRSESVAESAVTARNLIRCRLRYCTDIDSTMRIIVNRPTPTIYQIIGGPAILGNKDGIELMLEKVSIENS